MSYLGLNPIDQDWWCKISGIALQVSNEDLRIQIIFAAAFDSIFGAVLEEALVSRLKVSVGHPNFKMANLRLGKSGTYCLKQMLWDKSLSNLFHTQDFDNDMISRYLKSLRFKKIEIANLLMDLLMRSQTPPQAPPET